MNLILLEPGSVNADGRATLTGNQAQHVHTVLKLKPGDTFRVGMIDGPTGTATVHTVDDERVDIACVLDSLPPERQPVDLLLAMPRPKVMKRLWAQLAAMGVDRVFLVNAARVEKFYFDTHVIDAAFVREHLIEGLRQARDTHLPVVTIHREFRPFVEDELDALTGASLRLLAHPGTAASIGNIVRGRATDRVLLAVGPEGGWVPFEIELLEFRGFRRVSVGDRILRTDTACVALLALVHDALRD